MMSREEKRRSRWEQELKSVALDLIHTLHWLIKIPSKYRYRRYAAQSVEQQSRLWGELSRLYVQMMRECCNRGSLLSSQVQGKWVESLKSPFVCSGFKLVVEQADEQSRTKRYQQEDLINYCTRRRAGPRIHRRNSQDQSAAGRTSQASHSTASVQPFEAPAVVYVFKCSEESGSRSTGLPCFRFGSHLFFCLHG